MSSNDSLKNIIGVALGVCLVCAILVATAAVALKPRQEANKILEKRKNVLIAGALMTKGEDVNIDTIFSEKIQPVLIDLKTGDQLPDEKMTGKLAPENFDIKKLAKDKDIGLVIPSNIDIARIKRMPTQMLIYFVKESDGYSRIIFPVYGSGLWSTMYGFLALDGDLKTVRGFTFYEHGETPGLGGEVDNPKWQDSWKGKIAFDETGTLTLGVIKGIAGPDSTDKIDGLSGATLTTKGVDNLVKFWFGPNGYGPYLDKLKKGKG